MSSLGQRALYIPTEVCEGVIDMLYAHQGTADTVKDIATLHSCALVCRAWRVRSQKMLFYKVQLFDSSSLHKLAATLNTGQHLRDYVQEVQLTGFHLHATTSIFALFFSVFSGKLHKLNWIEVVHIPKNPTTLELYPWISDPPKFKSLPYMPLHAHLPAFLSSFTTISVLYLEHTTFRSFTEFARMLHGLRNLKVISCNFVRWITPGGSQLGAADLTKQPDWTAGSLVPPPFAPKLQWLYFWDMPKYGVERLIQTRGPHLKWLELMIPLLFDPEEEANGGIDLSSCTKLSGLVLQITSQFSMDKHATLVTETLASWKPQHAGITLGFRPLNPSTFTCRQFADTLHSLGAIVEASLQKAEPPSTAGSPEKSPAVPHKVSVDIYDWHAKREWWWNHLVSCFPTWARQRRLRMEFRTPQTEGYKWANEEETPLSDAVVPSDIEDAKSS